MATQFTLPRQVKINVAGRPYAGAQAFFYQNGTETLQTVYQDSALSVPHDQPVVADDDGYFQVIWLDSEAPVDYRVVILSGTGALLDDVPGIKARLVSQAEVIEAVTTGLDSLKETLAEIAANSHPVNDAYLPGNLRRYGAVLDGVTNDSVAVRSAFAQAAQSGGAPVVHPGGVCIVDDSTSRVINGNTYPIGVLIGSNVRVSGAGIGVSVFKLKNAAANNTRMFMLDGAEGVTFENFTIDGNSSGQTLPITDNGITGVALHNASTKVRFRSVEIKGFTQDCIQIGYPNDQICDDIEIDSGCRFSDFRRGGVTITDGRNIRIHAHFCDAVAGLLTANDGSNGVWLEPNSVSTTVDVAVTATFRNVRGGVYAANLVQADNFRCRVIGSGFDSVTQQAVYGSSAWHMLVSKNQFTNCGTAAAPTVSFPVEIIGGRWASIDDNHFRGCIGNAADIEVSGASLYIGVTKNVFDGSLRGCIKLGTTATADSGRLVSQNRIESGGTQTPNTYVGILVQNSSGTPGVTDVITENIVKTSTTTGLAKGLRTEYMEQGCVEGNQLSGDGTLIDFNNGVPNGGSATWNPGTVADGVGVETTISVAGANFTDASAYDVYPPYDLQGATVTAYCSTSNTVTVRLQNEAGTSRTYASGTWYVKRRPRY